MCTRCGANKQRSSRSRSRYSSQGYQHAPAQSPAPVIIQTPERESMFKDAAAVAGGVTVGTTAGHLAGEGISNMFGGGRRREEVVHALPQDYQLGEEPSGPCAFAISQFLQCATNHEDLQECQAYNEALKECKRLNRLPGSRSRYSSRGYQHAPARSPPPVITPPPQRSMFRDAASIAGGVTVGTTVGHLAGEAITGLFGGGRRREEVERALPRDYHSEAEPSGPCAYEISQFLQCATNHPDLQECQAYNDALKECKRRNRLP